MSNEYAAGVLELCEAKADEDLSARVIPVTRAAFESVESLEQPPV